MSDRIEPTASITLAAANAALLCADFTREQRRDFTVRKEILWESESATDADLTCREVEFIVALRANDPATEYNRRPKLRDASSGNIAGPTAAPGLSHEALFLLGSGTSSRQASAC